MRKRTLQAFEIDAITNSIRNVISGDSFQTEIYRLAKTDLKQITKKNKWNFNWKNELENNAKEVYKLTIINNPNVIQGLLSLSVEQNHIYISLLENAPFNIGKKKIYEGVAGNLIAYACKISFQRGFDGFVAFDAKTKLIEHYKNTLNAKLVGNQRMIIDNVAANILVGKYFKNE
jgi:hypothetical protein